MPTSDRRAACAEGGTVTIVYACHTHPLDRLPVLKVGQKAELEQMERAVAQALLAKQKAEAQLRPPEALIPPQPEETARYVENTAAEEIERLRGLLFAKEKTQITLEGEQTMYAPL